MHFPKFLPVLALGLSLAAANSPPLNENIHDISYAASEPQSQTAVQSMPQHLHIKDGQAALLSAPQAKDYTGSRMGEQKVEQNPGSRSVLGKDFLWAVVLGGAVVFASLI